MSLEQFQAVVSRAINDSAFRDLLAGDPDSALVGYDLSDDERTLLTSAQSQDFNELLLSLEQRVSKGGTGGPGPHPRVGGT